MNPSDDLPLLLRCTAASLLFIVTALAVPVTLWLVQVFREMGTGLVSPSPEQIVQSYKRRRNAQRSLLAVVAVIILAALLYEKYYVLWNQSIFGSIIEYAMCFGPIYLLAACLGILSISRCPACSQTLPLIRNTRFCLHCGVALMDEALLHEHRYISTMAEEMQPGSGEK